METSEQKIQERTHFRDRYSEYSDTQILEILKNHKNYQTIAVEEAVKIAVERQLINSDQDLFGPDFQQSKTFGFTIFPEISTPFHRERMIGSIFRFVYLMSLLPLIYGTLKYAEGQMDQTYLGWGTGVVWFALSLILNKTRKQVVFLPLLIILFSVSAVVCVRILKAESFIFLDLAIWIIATLLPLFFILYLRKLLRSIQN
ncbi:MAG: hypothetical protein JNK09_06955 [Prolixibacteraceae bacterium]|nr:hypothetical protein [Prolixibacteraceae bacterium]